LLVALKLGDAALAKRLMGEHLDHIEDRLALDESAGNRNLAKVFGRRADKAGA
jgi:DNA-binding GntR family transcriptional regulator